MKHIVGEQITTSSKGTRAVVKAVIRGSKAEGEDTHDKRPFTVKAKPSFALDESEREEILDTLHKDEYSSLPPSQIVPALADKGIYLGSESSFYRISRQEAKQPQG